MLICPFPDLPTVVFMGSSLLWFLAFLAVLAAWAALPEKYPKDHQLPRFETNVVSFIGKSLSHLRFKMNLPKKLRI